jgi:hypothetical protein
MKLKLTIQSVSMLREVLAAAGWSKGDSVDTIKNTYLAGKMLTEVIPEPPKIAVDLIPTKDSVPADIRFYENEVAIHNNIVLPEFELDDRMVAACKQCLSHFLKEGRFPAGRHTNALIDAFSLI